MTGFRNSYSILACSLLLLVFPAATAQSTDLQIAQNSNGACTREQPSARPDIISTPYAAPKPKPDAITIPVLTYSVDPETPYPLRKGFSGSTEVALLVDTNGKPQQVHVEKSLNPELDKAAVSAVQQYRFYPALQYGRPVPVKICVEIIYRNQ